MFIKFFIFFRFCSFDKIFWVLSKFFFFLIVNVNPNWQWKEETNERESHEVKCKIVNQLIARACFFSVIKIPTLLYPIRDLSGSHFFQLVQFWQLQFSFRVSLFRSKFSPVLTPFLISNLLLHKYFSYSFVVFPNLLIRLRHFSWIFWSEHVHELQNSHLISLFFLVHQVVSFLLFSFSLDQYWLFKVFFSDFIVI